jgi:RNA polymerase sigma factor for flagellar operon FliA
MTAVMLRASSTTGDVDPRQALMHSHLGLVHHVARSLARQLHDRVELDELVSAGTIGLVQAMESFDPHRGLSFSTFAVPRIRGAILDELRRQDRVPRSVRRKTRAIAEVRESLARELGRLPRHSELSQALSIPESTLLRWELDVERSIEVSLDRPAKGKRLRSDTVDEFDEGLRDQGLHEVDERLTREQQVTLLAGALGALDAHERAVLSLYYLEELKLREIADVLELSASRISQIRTEALSKLRRRLAPRVA